MEKEKTGKELLEEIKLEKEKMIKERKLKKEKPLPDIKEEEIPYEIPENWVWCRLGEVVVNRDSERKPLNKSERDSQKIKIYDYYGASGVIDKVENYIYEEKLLLVGEDGANLISRNTPIAFIAEGKYWVNNHAHVLQPMIKIKYLENYINLIDISTYVTGSAQPKLNQDKLNKIILPLPPLSTQKKIVDYLESIMDKIKESRSLFEEALEKIKLQRTAILHKAITGQLTEQLESDGNAKELLEEIKLEKEKMIKEGKIKKEKPLPEISQEEIPFDIPENWVWCRLGEIITINRGVSYKKYDEVSQRGYLVLRGGNLTEKGIIFEDNIYVKDEVGKKGIEIKKGDIILVASTGSSKVIGRACQIREDLPLTTIGAFLILCRPNNQLNKKIVGYYFKSSRYRNYISVESKGTNIKNIKSEYLNNLLFPLPPLSEQERIVEILERNFERLDEIEEMIKENQNKLELLEKSILEKAFRGEIIK